jgi:hypothetical protein
LIGDVVLEFGEHMQFETTRSSLGGTQWISPIERRSNACLGRRSSVIIRLLM